MNFVCFLTFVTFIVVFGLIIWEKIPRMYLALFGAVFVVALGVFDITQAIAVVNWETIGFLLGMLLLIEILAESGFFRWVSLVLARALKYQPLKILIFFPVLSFILSAFINSITVMVFLSVITYELSKLLKFDLLPVIVSEVVLSNIGGAATLVGDPPNIILGTVLGFGFIDFLVHNAPIAIIAGGAAICVSYMMNRNKFARLHPHVELEEIKNIVPRSQITNHYLLKCGLTGITVALILLIGKPLFERLGIPVHISTASLLPAFAILTFGGKKIYRHHFIRRIDSESLLFFIGLFILIGALEKRFIIQASVNYLASLFTTSGGFISSIFWGSSIFSAFVDNVPLAMAMSYVIKQSVMDRIVPAAGILVWATSLGVDLGGTLTPIGASSNVVAYSYLEKNGIKVSWGRWLRLALPQGIIALVISYLGILIKLHLNFF
ncbi:MAG: SLC13 family permease [Candidatus Aureabacteria bacterium]|nr:SLC13 family permease [Candidatus Auribacterota bacterium]